MAFSLKTWVNRISEYPNRRKLTHEDGSTELVTVARAEGQISAEGNAFSAEEMNDLENRIKGGFDEVNQSLNKLNEGIGCSYNGIDVIYRSNSDISEGLYTSTRDGFVQGIAKTAAKSGIPFARLLINNALVFEGSALAKNYSYLWTPLFEVRKGDIIKYTLTSGTDDGTKELRIYKHRQR